MTQEEQEPVSQLDIPTEEPLNTLCEEILEKVPVVDRKYVALKVRDLADKAYLKGIDVACDAVSLGFGVDEDEVKTILPAIKKLLNEDPSTAKISQRLPQLKKVLTSED